MTEKLGIGWCIAAGQEAGRRDREVRANSQSHIKQQREREWAAYMGNGRNPTTDGEDPTDAWLKSQQRSAKLEADRFALEVKK